MTIEVKTLDSQIEKIQVQNLLSEYSIWLLDFDSIFRNYVGEIDNLIEHYRFGKIITLQLDKEIIGCGCLLKLDENTCELKRIFITEKYRNQGLGKLFLKEIINIAKSDNYKTIKLGTFNFMESAIFLYKLFSFREIEPYKTKIIAGMKFFELNLQ